jgi:hypothetical protein
MAEETTTKTQAELDAEAAAAAQSTETEEQRVAREAEEAAAAAAAASSSTTEETADEKAAREAREADDKMNRRFSDLTRREKAALRRAEEAERTAAMVLEMATKGITAATKTAEKEDEDVEPSAPKFEKGGDPEQFATEMAKYTKDISAWATRQALKTHSATASRAEQERAQRDEAQRIDAEYQTHREKALKELTDFEEIAEDPTLQVSPTMAYAMKSLGANAPHILY